MGLPSRRTRLELLVVAVVCLQATACSSELSPGRSDAGSGADAGPVPADAGAQNDAVMTVPDAGELVGRGAIRDEICGNGFDDDDNGRIDDGCECTVGTDRPCWLGPPDARNVGVCHDGVQRCESEGATASWGFCNESVMPGREILSNGFDDDCDSTIDEADGLCVSTANEELAASCGNGVDDDCDTLVDCDDPSCVGAARCPPGCAATETVCWGGYDDDCDGLLDCADPECTGHPACGTGPCPTGQTPVYRERDLGASWGSSSVSRGDGEPTMRMTCEPGRCPSGMVAVERVGQPLVCVPPPPECPAGTFANYVASGAWRCDPPCDYLIHYGSIYGGRNVCAGRPMLSCSSGQVPTFVYETQVWQCRATCDNSLYDRIMIDGLLVCVPC